jgi:hypothetical protein
MDAGYNKVAMPQTAIFLGNGCSLSLGAPTSEGFLDAIVERLLENSARSVGAPHNAARGIDWNDSKTLTDSTSCLEDLKKFLGEIKGAKLTLSSALLNIEGLYRVAETREEAGLLANLNKAIYWTLRNIGDDFIYNEKLRSSASDWQALNSYKNRSLSLTPSLATVPEKNTTLIAYLCLASFRETGNLAPLFVQLNWDLGLDRALWCLNANNTKDREQFQWLNCNEALDFKATPLVLKPRGSINWHHGLINPKTSKTTVETMPVFKQELNGLRSLNRVKISKVNSDIKWAEPYENLKQIYCLSQPEQEPEDNALPDNLKNLDTYIKATGMHSGPLTEFFGENILLSPTIWKPENAVLKKEAKRLTDLLKDVQRILIIGVDSALDDSNFTLLLAEALGQNSQAPKIYIWNPHIFSEGQTRKKYLSLFAPVAREGRLFGIRGYFGDPALYDLDRVFYLGEKINL